MGLGGVARRIIAARQSMAQCFSFTPPSESFFSENISLTLNHFYMKYVHIVNEQDHTYLNCKN